MEPPEIEALLRQVEILRPTSVTLSTFGATRIAYHLLSPLREPRNGTRVRRGTVVSERPRILTPESLAERFRGFGDAAPEFSRWLSGAYRDLLRALEYTFKNEGFTASVVNERPSLVAERVKADLDAAGERHGAVLRCPDSAWALALMKFTLDEAARSFPVHLRDLERRGLFDPDGRRGQALRRDIERLFAQAAADPSARDALGARLREHGLFEEYEDRFLGLF